MTDCCTLLTLPVDLLDDIYIRARTPVLACVCRELSEQFSEERSPRLVVACALGRAMYDVEVDEVPPSLVRTLHALAAHGKDRYLDIAIAEHVKPYDWLDRLLRSAAMMNDATVVRALMRRGASDADGRELKRAAAFGDLELVDALMLDDASVPRLKWDASGKVEDRSKRRQWVESMGVALVQCAEKGHCAVAAKLLGSLVRCGAAWFVSGVTCLKAYKRAIAHGRRDVMDVFNHFGTPVDFDNGGAIALAVACGQTDVVKHLLLKLRKDPTAVNPDGQGGKPLLDACALGNVEVVLLLLATGRVSTSLTNGTALVRAVERGNRSIVRMVLENGGGVKGKALRAAHHLASLRKRVDLVYEIALYSNNQAAIFVS